MRDIEVYIFGVLGVLAAVMFTAVFILAVDKEVKFQKECVANGGQVSENYLYTTPTTITMVNNAPVINVGVPIYETVCIK